MTERFIISEPYYFTEPISHCGYCKDVANCTIGVQVELISVEKYGQLCNMGFRRSGRFLYKPDLLRNCCRMYTIRTTAGQVRVSKDIKSCVKRFKKMVLTEQQVGGRKGPFNYMKEIMDIENNTSNFETRFEPSAYSEEKYALFAKYQKKVHNDYDHTPNSFKRFLCDTPFSPEVVKGTKREWDQLNNWNNLSAENFERLGPAHECYFYKGKLIALAVLDILPDGISSVYFIWDPGYHKWSLGKLSALRELTICNRIRRKYYYMGYYIDDCPKMNYKSQYGGELMDVCNFKYAPLSFLERDIKHGKFFVLSDQAAQNDELDLNDRLMLPATAWEDLDNLHNVAENIYGVDGNAFVIADKAAEELSKQGVPFFKNPLHDICSADIDNKDIYRIPNVIPGLVPLHEILQLVSQRKIISLNNKLLLFNTVEGRIRFVANFENELPQIKRTICNLVRLFGLQNMMDAMIII